MNTNPKYWKWMFDDKYKIVARSWHTERLPEGMRATVTFLKNPNGRPFISVEIYENSTSTDKYFNVFYDSNRAMAWTEEVRAFIESKNSKE